MTIDHVEVAFRVRMLALAHKGGAVTKRRYGNNARYYRDIGRLGGKASVVARKARLAAELDGVATNESQIVDGTAASAEAPQAPPRPALSTLKQLMATQGKPSPYRSYTSRSDDFAEQQVARIMAQMNHPEDEIGMSRSMNSTDASNSRTSRKVTHLRLPLPRCPARVRARVNGRLNAK